MARRTASANDDGQQENALGSWVRQTRSEQSMSQRELASRAGLSRSYVCDIERGRGAHPSMETLDKLAAAMGVARLDLLKASGVIEPETTLRESDEERRMLSVYRDLSDAGRVSVMRFARFVHGDEHQWIQANMLDGFDAVSPRTAVGAGYARSLFDSRTADD